MRPLKRVIDGHAYNTETSAIVHALSLPRHALHTDANQQELVLYRSRYARYFFIHWNEVFNNLALGIFELRDTVTPVSRKSAELWLEEYCPEKLEKFLVEPAENTSVIVSLRMDASLRDALIQDANKKKVSLNMVCVNMLANAVESLPQSIAEGRP